VLLSRWELEVRRTYPMDERELAAVRAAVRGGRPATVERLRAPTRALAEATLKSTDAGIAHPWLLYGLLVLAVVNVGRWIADHATPWALPMAALYVALAVAGWLGRRARRARAGATLAAMPEPPMG
jgi:hypothetical protein